MTKLVEVIVVLALLLFSFFLGVRYSDKVKEHASWMFETREEEVELPDLSGGSNGSEYGDLESTSPVDEDGQPIDSKRAPMESGDDVIMDGPAVGKTQSTAPGSI